MNDKKVGRPKNSVSTIYLPIETLVLKFGLKGCVPVGATFLKKNGLINDVKVEYKLPEVLTTSEKKPSIKIVDFDTE